MLYVTLRDCISDISKSTFKLWNSVGGWAYVFSCSLHHECKLSKAVFSCLQATFLRFSIVWYLSSSSGLFQAQS